MLLFDELTVPMFYTERGRQAALALLALAGIGCVYALIHGIIMWYSDYVLTHTQPKISVQVVDETSQLIQKIPEAHLFGQQLNADSVPVTSLQLHLTGIIKVTGKDNLSKVLISQQGRPAKIYGVGDVLDSGVKIHAINADNVVIEYNGHFEKLPLSRLPLLFEKKPKSLWQPKSSKESL